eukprot:9835050-Prorocentrum_lima.AAC.1
MAAPDYHFYPDKEEELMNEARPSYTLKTGEAEPFIKERGNFEEDQLLKELPMAQVDKWTK